MLGVLFVKHKVGSSVSYEYSLFCPGQYTVQHLHEVKFTQLPVVALLVPFEMCDTNASLHNSFY